MKHSRKTFYLNSYHDDRLNLYLAVPLFLIKDLELEDELYYDIVINRHTYETTEYDVGHGSMVFLRYNFDEPEKCDYYRFLTRAAMNFIKVVITDSVYPEKNPETGGIDTLRYNRNVVFSAAIGMRDPITGALRPKLGVKRIGPMYRYSRSSYWCAKTQTWVSYFPANTPDLISQG